jgi:hypothetical protein
MRFCDGFNFLNKSLLKENIECLFSNLFWTNVTVACKLEQTGFVIELPVT